MVNILKISDVARFEQVPVKDGIPSGRYGVQLRDLVFVWNAAEIVIIIITLAAFDLFLFLEF